MNKKKLLLGDFTLKRLLRSLIFFYLSLALFALFFANRFLFQPPPVTYHDDSDILKIPTADGQTLSAIYSPHSRARYTILFSHGNAEDLGDFRPILRLFHNHGFAVFAYDYRGYGTSTGRPSETHARRDAEAAYSCLTETLDVPPDRIILFGRSLGAALALHLATHKPCAAVILQSPFASAFRVVTRIRLLPFDKFNNLQQIQSLRRPLLIIHGARDSIIPIAQGRLLYQHADCPKLALWLPHAAHNDLFHLADADYWNKINQLTQLLDSP